MCDKQNFRPLSKIRFSFFILLFLVLLVGAVSAGTFSDAQNTANQINVALAGKIPYSRTLTMSQLSVLGYDVVNMSRPCPVSGYAITIKSASYNASTGLLSLYLNAACDGKSIAVRNPIHWYMPFSGGLAGTSTQQLNSFVKMLISVLEQIRYGEPENDDSLVIYPSIDSRLDEGTDGSFASLRADVGDTATTQTEYYAPRLMSTSTTDVYDYLRRVVMEFDTSVLDDTAVISLANISLRSSGNSVGFGACTAGITGGVVATNGSAVAGDYDGFIDTEYITRFNCADFIDGYRYNFTMNTAGKNTIDKTGWLITYIRLGHDIDNSAPTWASATAENINWYGVTNANVDRRPYLYLEYSLVPPPVCQFSADDPDACTGQTITFTDSSTNNPTDWDWDVDHNINHGKDYDTQNPTHEYGSANTYDVELYCGNAGGYDTELKVGYISIDGAITAGFSADDTDVCTTQEVAFIDASSGTEESYCWDVDHDEDCDYVTQNAAHTYGSAGVYSVSEIVDNSGCSPDEELKNSYISVDAALTADFTYGDITICEGESVIFTDASSGTEESYTWDCTNDDVDDYTTQNAECTYPDAGTYSVEHCVDNSGCSQDCEVKADLVVVSECPIPVAAFSCIPLSGYDPLSVDCTDSSTGSPTSWSWKRKTTGEYIEFSTDQNPTDISFTLGTWDVKLTATNAYGYDDEEKLDYIIVSSMPSVIASFTYNIGCGDEPLSVQFNDTSSGGPDEWFWDFNEGNTSILQNPLNIFYNGTYSVYFHATNTTIPDDDWENKTALINVPCSPYEPTWWDYLVIGVIPLGIQQSVKGFLTGIILVIFAGFLMVLGGRWR